ncbi:MAG: hypothetical protein IPM85_13695 [Chitinophagaceae bacterium]|nr:hypothetical protein [Chitinophagaceae bacterium]
MMVIESGVRNPDGKYSRKRVLSTDQPSGETINQLLLSADEFTIAEKTAFINLYLKADDGTTAYEQIKSLRKEVYSKILNRRLNNVKRQGNKQDDFLIKAVPK